MVRHGASSMAEPLHPKRLAFTLICMEAAGYLQRWTAFHAVFTRYETKSTHAAAKKIK